MYINNTDEIVKRIHVDDLIVCKSVKATGNRVPVEEEKDVTFKRSKRI